MPQDKMPKEEDKLQESSMAWYLLPLFLGVLGGIIAFVRLRKRHRRRAYNTLGFGMALTIIFSVWILWGITNPGFLPMGVAPGS